MKNSRPIHLVYMLSGGIYLLKKEVNSWRDIQDEYKDHQTSLSFPDIEAAIEYIKMDYPYREKKILLRNSISGFFSSERLQKNRSIPKDSPDLEKRIEKFSIDNAHANTPELEEKIREFFASERISCTPELEEKIREFFVSERISCTPELEEKIREFFASGEEKILKLSAPIF